jgi:hypothetical protein
MKHLANFLHDHIEFFKEERNQKLLILVIFVLLCLCFLIFLRQGTSRRGEEVSRLDQPAAAVESMTPAHTPTKWWLRTAAAFTPAHSELTTRRAPAETTASDCPVRFFSPLTTNIYAYISLAPPLPNRIRSAAKLSGNYLGQIESGGSLKVIDGPICADGYSWWLVESLQGDLRGWTVEGKGSEQWVVPCPNEHVACSQTMVPVSPAEKTKTDKNKDNPKSNCQSDKFAIDMVAQVPQDGLLVLRSEPYTGGVNGRAGPMSIVKVIDGPSCAENAVWWKVSILDLGLTGWTTENNLHACPKDSECNLGYSN